PDGLLQPIAENEVARMLWELNQLAVTQATMYAALESPQMNTHPFGRGNTRHTWNVTPSCDFSSVYDTGASTPMFADFLDALRCGGVGEATVDAATNPSNYYPYPSSSPLCPP